MFLSYLPYKGHTIFINCRQIYATVNLRYILTKFLFIKMILSLSLHVLSIIFQLIYLQLNTMKYIYVICNMYINLRLIFVKKLI